MEAIILAGGRGKRLANLTTHTPKPMLSVAGKPFLVHILYTLRTRGITEVIISVGYLRESIMRQLKNNYGGMTIAYAEEKSPLGTGGGLFNALPLCKKNDVLVLNGDSFSDINYFDMMSKHKNSSSRMTIGIKHVPDTSRYGRVNIKSGMISMFEEKGVGGPGFINVGVYIVQREYLLSMETPAVFSLERDFLISKLDELKPRAYKVNGYFIDIGIPESYKLAQGYFRMK